MVKKYIIIFLLASTGSMISCQKSSKGEVDFFHHNIKSLDSVRVFLEKKYSSRLGDSMSSRPRVTFVDCEKEGRLSMDDYICDDIDLIKWMKNNGITEISFEEPKSQCNPKIQFRELMIFRRNSFYELGAYFVYEYCGTTSASKTQTFEYIPINANWSIQIDRN